LRVDFLGRTLNSQKIEGHHTLDRRPGDAQKGATGGKQRSPRSIGSPRLSGRAKRENLSQKRFRKVVLTMRPRRKIRHES